MFNALGPLLASALSIDHFAISDRIYIGSRDRPAAPMGHRNHGASRFDPRINRHTGKPHKHEREIARRIRQAAK